MSVEKPPKAKPAAVGPLLAPPSALLAVAKSALSVQLVPSHVSVLSELVGG